jgi:hypothetical protein
MADETHIHVEARRRWIAVESGQLAQEGKKIVDEPTREDRFQAISAVISRGKAVDRSADIGIGTGKPSTHFENNGDQNCVVGTGRGHERIEFIGSMVQSDLHRVVGTADGRGVPGASQQNAMRRGDRNLDWGGT